MKELKCKGNLIEKIRSGEFLDEISACALERLFESGPVEDEILEILSYIKIFQNEYFKSIENEVIETMGLFFKKPKIERLHCIVFDFYAEFIKEKWGENYTPIQSDMLKQIEQKQWFSFSAPTSTGKSFVFRNLVSKSKRDIVIIVPSRALINEYFDRINSIVNVKEVNVLTFVEHINIRHAKRNVLILTPERAKDLFKNKNWLDIEYIFFDEAQLSDEVSTRGVLFDSIVRRSMKSFYNSKYIFAHPFINNPQAQIIKNKVDFEEKSISRQYKQKNVGQIFYAYKPEKNEYYHFGTKKELFGYRKIKTNYDPVDQVISNGGSVLFYVSKSGILNKSILEKFKKYTALCEEIQDPEARSLIEKLRLYIGATKENDEYYKSNMIDLLSRGIVTHHGSMPLSARLILEHFTQKGFCRLCFATSTLEQGINMPFDIVYIDRFEKSKSLSVKNLIGRAGRSTVENVFDVGSVIVNENCMSSLRNILFKDELVSEISHLDKKDENIDEKYQEFKDAINQGTYNDDYNLTNNDVEIIKSRDIREQVPDILDSLFLDNTLHLPKKISQNILDSFKKLYEIYLGRELVISEHNVLCEAIRIMLWKMTGRTFKNICHIRYARVSRVSERRENPQLANTLHAKYMVGYNDLPNKKLLNYPLINTDVLAKNVDYDLIVYDTYDFLDKLIGFKLSDIYYAIFNEYYLNTQDKRAMQLANYIKFGTSEKNEIWMLKYGFDFVDIEWLKPCIEQIDENEIIFNAKIDNLDSEKRKKIEKYVLE